MEANASERYGALAADLEEATDARTQLAADLEEAKAGTRDAEAAVEALRESHATELSVIQETHATRLADVRRRLQDAETSREPAIRAAAERAERDARRAFEVELKREVDAKLEECAARERKQKKSLETELSILESKHAARVADGVGKGGFNVTF